MCCAMRKTFLSYRFTNSLNASRSPFLAAWTSAISLVISSSAFFWMVSMPLRLKINLLCSAPQKGMYAKYIVQDINKTPSVTFCYLKASDFIYEEKHCSLFTDAALFHVGGWMPPVRIFCSAH